MPTKTKNYTKETDEYQVELDLILSELKKGKEPQGRKIGINVEKYKAFWFYFLQTKMVEWSLDKANITEQTYRTLKTAPTFQRLLQLREEDLKAVAMINLSRSVRGREAIVDQNTGKQIAPAIEGSVEDSKWVLTTVYGINKQDDKGADVPIVGAPRNEEEAKLMAEMLNWHYEYRRKHAGSSDSTNGGGDTSKSKGTTA